MRAAVLTEINSPLQILDLEQEGPQAGEVRVAVKAAGVCMSDQHIINGDWPLRRSWGMDRPTSLPEPVIVRKRVKLDQWTR